MSGADAVLAHGLLNAVTAISAGASTLRGGRTDQCDALCTILERQSEMVEAFVYGMTDTARQDLEKPLWNVISLAAQVVDAAQHDPRTAIEALASALSDASEDAAVALRDFVLGFGPEVVAALDGLGEQSTRSRARFTDAKKPPRGGDRSGASSMGADA